MSRAGSIALAAGAVVLFGAAVGLTQANRAVADNTAITTTKVQTVSIVNPIIPVNAAGPSAVTLQADPAVANTFAGSIVGGKTALVVQEANNAQHPYTQSAFLSFPASGPISGETFTPDIPAGKRLVIETVSVHATVPPGQHFDQVLVITRDLSGFDVANVGLVPVKTATSSDGTVDHYFLTQPLRLYAEPGTPLRFIAERDANTGQAAIFIQFVGYLVDAP
jgi:hypothetical protein